MQNMQPCQNNLVTETEKKNASLECKNPWMSNNNGLLLLYYFHCWGLLEKPLMLHSGQGEHLYRPHLPPAKC